MKTKAAPSVIKTIGEICLVMYSADPLHREKWRAIKHYEKYSLSHEFTTLPEAVNWFIEKLCRDDNQQNLDMFCQMLQSDAREIIPFWKAREGSVPLNKSIT